VAIGPFEGGLPDGHAATREHNLRSRPEASVIPRLEHRAAQRAGLVVSQNALELFNDLAGCSHRV
jgi:hypothetical protein